MAKVQLKKDQLEKLKSREWRLSHLYKVVGKNGRVITFKKNSVQEDFDKNKGHRNIILKARQLGFTTFEAVDMLDAAMWTPHYQALMISYDKQSADDIFDSKVKFAWDNIPMAIQDLYVLDADRKNKIKFNLGDYRGSKAYSELQVRLKGRSGTYNRVHISEFGKICKEYPLKAKEIITGTIPSVPSGGRLDIESTAEGDEGYFHNMFWEAWDRGEPETPLQFKAHFYNWQWDKEEIANVPLIEKLPAAMEAYKEEHGLTEREISYYYQKWLSLNKDWKLMKQEYPTTPEEAFAYSGVKMFDQAKLSKQEVIEGEKVGRWIYYKRYVPSHRYGLGADVAEGVGQDSSTAVIIDFTANEVVAEFADSTIEPDMFAHEIKNAANKYGGCLCAVERNSIGHTTNVILKQIYPAGSIYKERKDGNIIVKESTKLGWHTNSATKPLMMYELVDAINEELLTVNSRYILPELRSYDKQDLSQTRFDPDQTNHWDRVMALAIAWQMRKHARQRGNLTGPSIARGVGEFNRFDVI